MSRFRPLSRGRRAALVILLPLAAALLVVVLAGLWLVRDPAPHFAARYAPIVQVEESAPRLEDGHRVHDVRLTSASGLVVELTVKRPDDASAAPRPVALLLGGHRTGRDAAALIADTRGTVVASLSYPFHGNDRVKGVAVLGEAPAIRGALLDTPPAIRLALDYLLEQPWADAARVEGIGVSLGAPFMTIAGALDERIGRVWSIHGAGDPYGLLNANLERYVATRPARAAVAGFAHVAINGPGLAPERWVSDIAPRPFIMINASDDARIPRASVHTLYDAAEDPRELIWMTGGHVGPRRADIVQQLVDMVFARMGGTGGVRATVALPATGARRPA